MKKIKVDISLGATRKEREDKVKRMMKIQKLLKHFEVNAFAFDPGVRCYKECVGGKGLMIEFDEDTWEFMEPLFKELLKYRKYAEKFRMKL